MTNDDERQDVETATEEDAIDLDTDQEGDLDEAMREALEAIETGGETPAERPDVAVEEGVAEPEDTLAGLQRQLAEERERTLRALADLENYRKRVQRERREEQRFRGLEPLRDMLAILDNLERALAAPGSVEDLKKGVEMILRQMHGLLESYGVERIEALGEPFDPSLHEAVSRDEDSAVPGPTVSEEMQAGYTMHGRLLRPAVVKVSMPARSIDEPEDEVD